MDALPHLGGYSASDRIAWALSHLPSVFVVSTSFGAQSVVSLHLLTRHHPDIPVIFVDTGHLFEETYQFADRLTDKLRLNLKVYTPRITPAWHQARHGKTWEHGLEGLTHYNQDHKVEPLSRALEDLKAGTWFTGRRRQQSSSRQDLPLVERMSTHPHRYKVNPILDWSDRDIGLYMSQHDLPYHPLWHQGYISIGDVHTTRRWEPGMNPEDTRFFGLKRECGIHEI